MVKAFGKYFCPHFCPDCGKLMLFVRHPFSRRCSACHNKYRRKSGRRSKRSYSNSYYRRNKSKLMEAHHFCALCGSEKNLTCHHCVDVKSGEWAGKHLTILCNRCHQLWEAKVNKERTTIRG